jgi:hypothetical protein
VALNAFDVTDNSITVKGELEKRNEKEDVKQDPKGFCKHLLRASFVSRTKEWMYLPPFPTLLYPFRLKILPFCTQK